MDNITLKVLGVVCFLCLLAACGGGGGNDNPQNAPNVPAAGPDVLEDVTQATTLAGNRVYHIAGPILVEATLTIEPGTILKFGPEANMSLSGDGTVIAEGTAASPILFTSLRDDEHGGDTNQDGNASLPAKSDWDGVYTDGTQGSIFSHCHFYYGGSECTTLDLRDSRAQVTHCVFAHNQGCKTGEWFTGVLNAGEAGPDTVIADNRFFDNYFPLTIGKNFSLDDTNTFQDPSGTITNTLNAVFFESFYLDRNISWQETEVAILIGGTKVYTGTTLSLGDDVVLKFISADAWLCVVDGLSALINHNGAGVFFTSYKDDTLKGDSNGDADATAPGNGDWDGIFEGDIPYDSSYYVWSNINYDSH